MRLYFGSVRFFKHLILTDVKKVIKYAKFYPEGERGVCRFVRAADYSSLNRNAFFKKENEKIIILRYNLPAACYSI